MKLVTHTELIKSKIESELLWQLKISYRIAISCYILTGLSIVIAIICGLLGKFPMGLVSIATGLLTNQVSNPWLEIWREAKRGIDRNNC